MNTPVTYSRASDWATRQPSNAAPIIVCPDCGNTRRDTGLPHAPRLSADRLSLVDCIGRVIHLQHQPKEHHG